jgi:hypothetical protein
VWFADRIKLAAPASTILMRTCAALSVTPMGWPTGGLLDFVLILGDLVDFLRHGFSDRQDFGDNNCRVFRT